MGGVSFFLKPYKLGLVGRWIVSQSGTWRCTSGRGVFFSEALQVRFGRSVDSVTIRDLAMYKWAGCLFF